MSKYIIGERYHIFNRGVEKRDVFMDTHDYQRFIEGLREFNTVQPIGNLRDTMQYKKALQELNTCSKPLVKIIAYCLNSNHYHLILEEIIEGGISEFMKRVSGGYTLYFNKKYERSGALFQGRYKKVLINSNEYLLYLSAYVNQNHYIHGYKEANWLYSSLLEYQNKRQGGLCDKRIIMEQFNNNVLDYVKFMNLNAEYLKDKKEFSKLILE